MERTEVATGPHFNRDTASPRLNSLCLLKTTEV